MGRLSFLKNPNNMMFVMIGGLVAINQISIRLFPYDSNAQSAVSICSLVGIFGFIALGGMAQREKAKGFPHLQDDWTDSHGNDGEVHLFLTGAWFVGRVGPKASAFKITHEPVDIGSFKGVEEQLIVVPAAPKEEKDVQQITSLWTGIIGFRGRRGAADYGTEIEFDHPASARISTMLAPMPHQVTNLSTPVPYLLDSPGIRGDLSAGWRKLYERLSASKTKEILDLLKRGDLVRLEGIQGVQGQEAKALEEKVDIHFAQPAPRVEKGEGA